MKNKIVYIGNKLSKHGFTPTNIETLGPLLENAGYQVVYASEKRNPVLRLADMLFTIASNRKTSAVVLIDTYSTSAFYFAWLSGRMAHWLGIPYVPILHGGNLPSRIKRSRGMADQLFGRSHVNVVISDYLKMALDEYHFNYRIIYNNILLSDYVFKARRMLRPNLIWVRSFHKIYNPGMALRSLEKIRQQLPEATLTMVGPDKDGTLEACKILAGQLGLTDGIKYTGRLSKKEWLALSDGCDIFINTSNIDNQPVSIIEAQALGFPIVSTNAGGVPFLISNNENGLLVDVDDSDGMSSAILQLIENPALAQRLSESARESAEKYDWSVIGEKWKALLDPMIEG